MLNLLFIGCGKMGSILVKNLLAKGFEPSQIKAIDLTPNESLPIEYFRDASLLPSNYQADVVFIAIKPQDSEAILSNFALQNKTSSKTIFVSILAGKKIAFFTKIFGKNAKIIRSMPNLPILVEEGVFAYLANKKLKESEEENMVQIFSNFGEVFAIKNEKLFDEFTAIFGSGPAYIFYLQEIFLKFSESFIEDKKQAELLVKKLFMGSALLAKNSEESFSQLKQAVTSKGGTTIAALEVLEKNNILEKTFTKAFLKAKKRAKELSNDSKN